MVVQPEQESTSTAKRPTKSLSFEALGGHLFGRDTESEHMRQGYESYAAASVSSSSSASTRHLVEITGRSGTGKSSLALQIKGLVAKAGHDERSQPGCFVSGKHNGETAKNVPYSAIGAACESLCSSLLDLKTNNNNTRSDTTDASFVGIVLPCGYQAFRDGLMTLLDHDDIGLFAAVMPSLYRLAGILDNGAGVLASNIKYLEVQHRFQYAFQRFIQLVGSFGPLVLLLDDVQWIDQASLDLMTYLLSDGDSIGNE